VINKIDQDGSGRVGRSTMVEDPVICAVTAYVRHKYTNYDNNFKLGMEKDENRDKVNPIIDKILLKWGFVFEDEEPYS